MMIISIFVYTQMNISHKVKEIAEMLEYKRLGNVILSEYVIWGIPPGESESTLLVASHKNEVITSKDLAEELKRKLENKFDCTECFIQKITF